MTGAETVRMTGAEHYREAERLALAARATAAGQTLDHGDGKPILDSQAADYAAVARVHATLAMAWMPPTPAVVPPAYPRLWVAPDAWGHDCVWLAETADDEDRPMVVAGRLDYGGGGRGLAWDLLTRGLPYIAKDDNDTAEAGQ